MLDWALRLPHGGSSCSPLQLSLKRRGQYVLGQLIATLLLPPFRPDRSRRPCFARRFADEPDHRSDRREAMQSESFPHARAFFFRVVLRQPTRKLTLTGGSEQQLDRGQALYEQGSGSPPQDTSNHSHFVLLPSCRNDIDIVCPTFELLLRVTFQS